MAQDGDNAINDETTAEVFRRRASDLDAHDKPICLQGFTLGFRTAKIVVCYTTIFLVLSNRASTMQADRMMLYGLCLTGNANFVGAHALFMRTSAGLDGNACRDT